MSNHDNIRSLRIALNLGMIDLAQFNRMMEAWEGDPTRDAARLLVESGLISEDQHHEILSLGSGERGEESDFTENFTLKGVVGEGGVGRVFIGYDKNIRREVAIKQLVADRLGKDRQRIQARFIREARISGQLEHPGIVPVYELGRKPDGSYFYVMKYVQGKTLTRAVEDCRSGSAEDSFRNRMKLLDKFMGVCEAMGYVHSKGVIHRDLKPSNIILGEFGETVILDWGLAKALSEDDGELSGGGDFVDVGDEGQAELTRQGAKLGTPSYMSPEQIDPKFGVVGTTSDVYSLGVILYVLLTGEKPYKGKGEDVMTQITSDVSSPTPDALGDFIPAELVAICGKAMSKKQDDRFRNASDMLRELKAYRDGRLLSVYSYSKKELFRRFVSKNKVAISAAAAIVLTIVAGASLSLNFAVDAHKARKRALHTLVDVTGLSENTMALSRNAVNELGRYIGNLTDDMERVAGDLTDVNLAGSDNVIPLLEGLRSSHPEADGFSVAIQPGRIVAAFPEDYISQISLTPAEYERLLLKFKLEGSVIKKVKKTEDGDFLFVVRVPIYGKLRMAGMLSTRIRTDRLIPAALSFDPRASDYQVWCMQDDGYILYDEDEKQVGKLLFTDEMYADFPELLAFGERMKGEPWGVGHYVFTSGDGSSEVYKVAAWDTIIPMDEAAWKIVVTYPYVER